MDTPPITASDALYHYTTISGFLGITRRNSACIWVTDYRYLNDTSEGQQLVSALKEEAANIDDATHQGNIVCPPAHTTLGYRRSAGDHARRFLEDFDSTLKRMGFMGVTCFTEQPDKLSQWRAYGGGQGVAVQFSKSRLHALAASRGYTLIHCTYGRPHSEAQLMLEQIEHDRRSQNEYSNVLNDYRAKYVLRRAVAFKNDCFFEEKELRLVSPTYGGFAHAGDIRASGDHTVGEREPLPVHFRPGTFTPIPYMEFMLEDGLITGARVGPTREPGLSRYGVEMALRQMFDHSIQEYEVRPSDIPYRAAL